MESRHIREWQNHEVLPNVASNLVKGDLKTMPLCRSAPVSYAGTHHYARDFVSDLSTEWVDC